MQANGFWVLEALLLDINSVGVTSLETCMCSKSEHVVTSMLYNKRNKRASHETWCGTVGNSNIIASWPLPAYRHGPHFIQCTCYITTDLTLTTLSVSSFQVDSRNEWHKSCYWNKNCIFACCLYQVYILWQYCEEKRGCLLHLSACDHVSHD